MNPSAFLPDPALGPGHPPVGDGAGPTCPFAALAQAIDQGLVESRPAGASGPAAPADAAGEANTGFAANVRSAGSSIPSNKGSDSGKVGDALQRLGSQESSIGHGSFGRGSPISKNSFKVACPMTGGTGTAPLAADAVEAPKPVRTAASRWAKVRAVAAMASLGAAKRNAERNKGASALAARALQEGLKRSGSARRLESGATASGQSLIKAAMARTQSGNTTGSNYGGEGYSRARRGSLSSVNGGGSIAQSNLSSMSRRNKQTTLRTTGGGIVVGEVLSRLDKRAGKRTKCPPYKEEDAAKHGAVINKTWTILLERVGYFELGLLYFDTIFSLTPEIATVFTRGRDEMGVKFVDMLAEMVSLCSTPPKLHDRLAGLSAMHIANGVESSMMGPMGNVLFKVIGQGIGNDFNKAARDAWHWLWDWLTKSMALTLNAAEEPASLVQTSWDLAMENFTEDQLGSMMYDTLFGIAPNLKSLFHRPKQVMAMKFVEMVSTLVSFADDDTHMSEQVTWLGARHVKYGARPHHIPIMSEVLLTVLEQAVGDEWRQDMHDAWAELWNKACGKMMESIKLGEVHGHVVEELWGKLTGKQIEITIGNSVVKYLSKVHPTLIATWSNGYSAWLKEEGEEEAKREKESETMDALVRTSSTATDPGGEHASGKHEGGGGGGESSPQKGGNNAGKGRFSAAKKSRFNIDFSLRNKKKKTNTQSMADIKALTGEHNEVDPGEAFGKQIWATLKLIIQHMWEPEVMNERLIVVATRWAKFGLSSSHVSDLGAAIMYALQQYMETPCQSCKMNDWTPEFAGAWGWLWSSVAVSLNKTLTSLEQQDSVTCRSCWELIKSIRSKDEVGEKLFSELGREAPHVVHLFQRPKKLQAYMWMQAVELLVVFTEIPQDFFDALKDLTIRHVKYGVKGEYVKPFGKAILAGIEDLAGDHWNEDMSKAWANLWRRISTCVGRSLNVGVNLITVAIVNGDIDKFKYAIECAPRKDRMSWVTRVEVYGSIMSPLFWAIRDGKFAIAQYMIQDLLAIRADRDMYYYGREHLFETHPDVIPIFCKDCPMLVEDLMDGLLWYSQHVLDGKVRANYYIRELYGDPQDTPDAWKSPLAVLCLHGQPQMFLHPVAVKLLELKWDAYGKKIFVGVQVFFIILIGLFMDGFLKRGNECGSHAIGVRYVCGALAGMAFILMTYIIVKQFHKGQTALVNLKRVGQFSFPRLLCNPWNMARYISIILLVIATSFDACHTVSNDSAYSRHAGDGSPSIMMFIVATIGLLLWSQLIQALVISTRLAALTYTIGQLFSHVGRFMLLMGIVIMSFAAALTGLQEPGFEDIGDSAMTLLRYFLSLAPPAEYETDGYGDALLVLFAIIIQVGLLSILIAQLALAYEQLSEDKAGYAKMNRAFVCVEVDSCIPMSFRRRIWDAFDFFKPIEFDNGDEGPSGGVQVLELASVRASPKYKPDRIIRCTGTADPHDPWPIITEVPEAGS